VLSGLSGIDDEIDETDFKRESHSLVYAYLHISLTPDINELR
jgi:hypothetical protein